MTHKEAVDFIVAVVTVLNPPDKNGNNTCYQTLNLQLPGEPPTRDPKDPSAVDWVYSRLEKYLVKNYPSQFPGNIVMFAFITEGPFAGLNVIRDGFHEFYKDGKGTIDSCLREYYAHRDTSIKDFSVQTVEAMLERIKRFSQKS